MANRCGSLLINCHTYATTLVNAGMTLQALMQLLGHSSPEMTMRYANPRELHQTRAKVLVAC